VAAAAMFTAMFAALVAVTAVLAGVF